MFLFMWLLNLHSVVPVYQHWAPITSLKDEFEKGHFRIPLSFRNVEFLNIYFGCPRWKIAGRSSRDDRGTGGDGGPGADRVDVDRKLHRNRHFYHNHGRCCASLHRDKKVHQGTDLDRVLIHEPFCLSLHSGERQYLFPGPGTYLLTDNFFIIALCIYIAIDTCKTFPTKNGRAPDKVSLKG